MSKRIYSNPKMYSPINPEKENLKVPNRIGVVIFWLVVIAGLAYLFLFSKYFKINDFMIQGILSVSEQDVKDKTASQTQGRFQSNIFLFNSKALEQQLLSSYPFFTQVQIFKGLPHTLQIKITERRAALVWVTGDQKYFIDENGIVFQFNDKNNSPDFPVLTDERDSQIKIADKIVTKDFIQFVQKINADFTAKTQLKINKISIKDNLFDVYVQTDNFAVIFSTLRSADDQLNDLATVMTTVQNQAKEYIDLRIEGKIYYK